MWVNGLPNEGVPKEEPQAFPTNPATPDSDIEATPSTPATFVAVSTEWLIAGVAVGAGIAAIASRTACSLGTFESLPVAPTVVTNVVAAAVPRPECALVAADPT